MKNLSKSLAVALCFALVAPCIAFAETEADTQTTDVEYVVAESYEWTVPAETVDADGGELAVSVTKNVIAANHSLVITVASQNSWYLVDATEATNKLAYTITPQGGSAWNTDAILTVSAGTNTGSVTGIGAVTKAAVEKAGTYKDVLTFTASVDSNN
ncbi:MAG: hypothetical protein Q4E75_05915 [bacterium]|nr:hypothetical protein [bacterium]